MEATMQNATDFTKKWLILAVCALAGAGIYSLPPVLFRGPFFKDILPVEAIFASSLVIHVDLSVLVWMLAIGGMLWSSFSSQKCHQFYKYAFYTAAAGMAFMAISPLTGNLNPLKNNYIPVLQNPAFFIGLGLFASGMILQMLLSIYFYFFQADKDSSADTTQIRFGLNIAAIIAVITAICFIIAGVKVPAFDYDDPQSFYEFIFWGGGHILQVVYTTLLICAWFILLSASGYKNPLPQKFIYILFGINLAVCLPAPFFYLSENSTSLFAAHMRYFMGISPLIAGVAVLCSLTVRKKNDPHPSPLPEGEGTLQSFLILSIFLFGYGGFLAYMIKGTNVIIPAHYHGSIVGITLAFMGLVYHYLPKVGFQFPISRAAKLQPYIYGIGQAMHITGLAVMGGYGALRKDAASSQNIDTILGKALFFSGGSLAILGGLMFVVVVFRAMRKKA